MQIDWLTVAAQIVNFLILVYLLKRFLYKPVTEAMARREQRIADRLNESREREEQAEHERERLHQRLEDLEQRRDRIMQQAKDEAEEERRRLMDEAREQSDAARQRWQQQAEEEKERFLDELRDRTVDGFETLARKALADLAEAELEAQMVRAFVARLQQIDGDSRRALAEGAADDGDDLIVITSFELDDGGRESLTDAIQQQLGGDVGISYQQSSDLLCGVELRAGGRRLGWTLADYLDRLEAGIEDVLGGATSGAPSSAG